MSVPPVASRHQHPYCIFSMPSSYLLSAFSLAPETFSYVNLVHHPSKDISLSFRISFLSRTGRAALLGRNSWLFSSTFDSCPSTNPRPDPRELPAPSCRAIESGAGFFLGSTLDRMPCSSIVDEVTLLPLFFFYPKACFIEEFLGYIHS